MDNSHKVILDLCGGTGSWSKPYEEAGYDVRIITLPEHDVRTYEPPENVYGILAAPPCIEFSVAKKRNIPRDYNGAMEVVNACLKIIEKCQPKFWALENPVGHLSKFLGPPVYKFQPWWFGDPWTKHTMLYGKFNLPKQKYTHWEDVPKLDGLYTRPTRKKPSIAQFHKSHKKFIPQFHHFNVDSDATLRAITPPGFARAFFEVNP